MLGRRAGRPRIAGNGRRARVARVHAAAARCPRSRCSSRSGRAFDRSEWTAVARHRHRQLERRRAVAAMSGRAAAASIRRSRWTRVMVVDNASTEDRRPGWTRADPLTIIRNTTNRGFGAACNQGRREQPRGLPAVPEPRRVRPARERSRCRCASWRIRPTPTSGSAGIQLRDAQRPVVALVARAADAAMIWARIVGLDAIAPSRVPSWFMTEWDHASTREVDHVIGAFYVIRRRCSSGLRGFDERFFVYLEDLDVSVRAAPGSPGRVSRRHVCGAHRRRHVGPGQGLTHRLLAAQPHPVRLQALRHGHGDAAGRRHARRRAVAAAQRGRSRAAAQRGAGHLHRLRAPVAAARRRLEDAARQSARAAAGAETSPHRPRRPGPSSSGTCGRPSPASAARIARLASSIPRAFRMVTSTSTCAKPRGGPLPRGTSADTCMCRGGSRPPQWRPNTAWPWLPLFG